MQVIVVGAGIIGASIAWHLARAGTSVTVIDGSGASATARSFGWINGSFYADKAHHRLRVEGIAAYGRMMADLPDLAIRMCGALWFEAQGPVLAAMRADLQAFGYPVEALSRTQAQAREPDLRGLPQDMLRFPIEGCGEPAVVAAQLLSAAQAQGARVVRGVQVSGVVEEAGQVAGVATSLGMMRADRVVVAAGNGAPDILASVGVKLPMLTRPGAMVTTKPVAARIYQILVTPHGEVRQLPDGRIMASAAANHQSDDASEVTENAVAIAARVLAWLDPMIAGKALEWDEVALAYRPVPADGLPVIGRAGPDGLHVAVMHSGVTLAAVVGEVIAADVSGAMSNAQADLVAPYRADRF